MTSSEHVLFRQVLVKRHSALTELQKEHLATCEECMLAVVDHIDGEAQRAFSKDVEHEEVSLASDAQEILQKSRLDFERRFQINSVPAVSTRKGLTGKV